MNPLDRARAYLDKLPAAVSGRNGHGATWRAACVLWNGFALSEDETLSLLRAFNTRCQPPWDEKALRHKARQAASKPHLQPRGYLLHAPPPHLPPRPDDAETIPPPAQTQTWEIIPKPWPAPPSSPAPITSPAPSTPSVPSVPSAPVAPPTPETTAALCERLAPLVRVPGCAVGRPPEIAVDDATWRTLDAAGFAADPLIQHALWLFGPGCRARVF